MARKVLTRGKILFNADTIQDLVDRNAEFVEMLETWSTESEPGQVLLNDGAIQYYFAVED